MSRRSPSRVTSHVREPPTYTQAVPPASQQTCTPRGSTDPPSAVELARLEDWLAGRYAFVDVSLATASKAAAAAMSAECQADLASQGMMEEKRGTRLVPRTRPARAVCPERNVKILNGKTTATPKFAIDQTMTER